MLEAQGIISNIKSFKTDGSAVFEVNMGEVAGELVGKLYDLSRNKEHINVIILTDEEYEQYNQTFEENTDSTSGEDRSS